MTPTSLRILKALAVGGVSSIVLVACGGGGGTNSTSLAANQTLTFPILADFGTLDPAVADAETDFGIRCRLILDVDKPSGPGHAMEMVEFAAAQDRDRLVGVGGDSVERDIDHRVFAPAFAEAARRGLRRTMHAGEDGPADNIRVAIEDLGCERIDHGFRLLDDPDLTRRVIDW